MSFKCYCNYCGQELEAEDNWEGQKSACPKCNQEITISRPPEVQAQKECPFCSEEIKFTAKKCKHCGEFLEDNFNPKPPPLNNTSQEDLGETPLAKTAKTSGFVAIITDGLVTILAVIRELFGTKDPAIDNASQNELGETLLPKGAKIFGFVSIFTYGITAIPAVICGHLGLTKLKQGYKGKKKDALIGIATGYIVIIIMLVGLISNSINTYQENAKKERLAKQTKIEKEKLAKQTKIEKGKRKAILADAKRFISTGNIDKAIKELKKIDSLKYVDRTEGYKLLNGCKLIKSPDCIEKYLNSLSSRELHKFQKKKGKLKETYFENTFLDKMFKEKLNKNLKNHLSLAKKIVYQRLKEEKDAEKKRLAEEEKNTFDTEFFKNDALNVSKVFVKRCLNITSTAIFPWPNTDKVKYIGKKRFQVGSYVDVKNNINVTSRMNYTCVVEREGKKWRKISLDMGEIYKQEIQKERIRAQKEFEKRKPELDQLARIIYGSRYINEKRESAKKSFLSTADTMKNSPKGATLYRFDALRIGISYYDAVEVMGMSGTELSRSHSDSGRSEYYQWEAPKGYGNGSMNVMFRNGKLVSKTQYRLE